MSHSSNFGNQAAGWARPAALMPCHGSSSQQTDGYSLSGTAVKGRQLLARGQTCPAGEDISMADVEIMQPLACTHNCFISTVKLKLKKIVSRPASSSSGSITSSTCGTGYAYGVAKSYRKVKLIEEELQQVQLEYQVHEQLSTSSSVVPFWAALDTSDSITILTARCEGDLRKALQQAGGVLSEETVKSQIAAPLIQLLAAMQPQGFIHRDIKPENIFMSGIHAMLGDFGLAVAMPPAAEAFSNTSHSSVADAGLCASSPGCSSSYGVAAQDTWAAASTSLSEPGCTNTNRTLAGKCLSSSSSHGVAAAGACGALPQLQHLQAGGTAAYAAPEVVDAAFHNTPVAAAVGPQNDVWSLAVVVFECLSGQHLFGDPGMSPGAFMCSISSTPQSKINARIGALPVSQACKDWLALALVKNPQQRLSAVELRQHTWLTEAGAECVEQQQMKPGQQQLQSCNSHGVLFESSSSDSLHSGIVVDTVSHDMAMQLSTTSTASLSREQSCCGWEAAAAAAASAACGGRDCHAVHISGCQAIQLSAASSSTMVHMSHLDSITSWEY